MKKSFATTLATVATLSVTLGLAGTAQAAPPSATSASITADERALLTPEQQATYDKLVAQLPADWEARLDAFRTQHDIEVSPVREVVEGRLAEAINPDDYTCGPTKLDAYVDSVLADVDFGTLFVLSILGVLDFPTYDALLYGTSKDPAFALKADKAVLTSSFNYAQRFWDVKLDDVQLMAMHGATLASVDRTARVVEVLYDMTPAEAAEFAADIVDLVQTTPSLDKGENPIFTLNAFAFSAIDEPAGSPFAGLPDKLVFGDGILSALSALGLKKVGPQAVMGHEMAHHAQYEANLFESDLPAPEATRRTELMADAFSSYFSTHKKGLGLNANQLLLVQDSFYNVGDCSFDNPGHHGTPNQRRAAASWGIATAATGDSAVKVIKTVKLGARFDKVLPQLVAPDAPAAPAAWVASVKAAS